MDQKSASPAQMLFAKHFLESANWHYRRIEEEIRKSGSASINPEVCYHAGACIEMFVDGVVAQHNPVALVTAKYREAMSDLENNHPHVHELLLMHTLPIGTILKDNASALAGTRLFGNGMLKFMRKLINERNGVVHRANAALSSDEVLGYLQVIRDWIRRGEGVSSGFYQCLTADAAPVGSDPAIVKLLRMEMGEARAEAKRRCHTQQELSQRYNAEIDRLHAQEVEIEKKSSDDLQRGRSSVSMCQCPVCGYPSFRVVTNTDPMATAWTGTPNASTSILLIPQETELTCPACKLDWDDTVLPYFQRIGDLEVLSRSVPVISINKLRQQILNLVRDRFDTC
jgi:hypothetical protein